MTDFGIQLFTLREMDEPLPNVIDRVDSTAMGGVEFVEWEHELLDRDPEPVRTAMEDADLDGPSVLIDIEPLEDRLDEVVDTYVQLGCESFVVGWLHPRNFETENAVAETADRLSTVAETCAERGFDLHYHNHDHEFTDLGGSTAYERLVERVDSRVQFELDVAWATVAGFDPTRLIENLQPSLVHLKDAHVDRAETAELGDGDVPIRACVETARAVGVDWLYYEYDSPADPVESLSHGATTLEALLPSV